MGTSAKYQAVAGTIVRRVVNGVDFHFSKAFDVDGQVDGNDVVTIFHASHHFVLTSLVDEVAQFLQFCLANLPNCLPIGQIDAPFQAQ